ncbi:MAG TPA: cellulase family glycosylhydrolase [Terriglobales bacterium]
MTHKLAIWILLLMLMTSLASSSGPGFYHVQGKTIFNQSGKPFRIRGIGLGDLHSFTEDDFRGSARLGFNTISLLLDWSSFYSQETPYTYEQEAWSRVDQAIALARHYKLGLILQMCGSEGAQFIPLKRAPFDFRIWNDGELQKRFLALWHAIAARYSTESQLIGYGLFCEPVTSGPIGQWQQLAQRAVDTIRQVDRSHILFVERAYGEHETRRELSGIDYAPDESFPTIKDNNFVYQFYFFERDEYTHQFAPWRPDVQKAVKYPDPNWRITYKEKGAKPRTFLFDKHYLDFYLRRHTEFAKRHNAPLLIWAFGQMKRCFDGQGGDRWLRDVTSIFEQQGVHWSYSDFRDDAFGISDVPAAQQILTRQL